jgi:hypothetical protein
MSAEIAETIEFDEAEAMVDASITETLDANTEVVVVTPDQAQEWLDSRPYAYQRSIRPKLIERLCQAMERREFTALTTLVFYDYNGKLYLVDGQHRLNAVVATGIPQVFVLAVKRVESYEEVETDYLKYDQGDPKSAADSLYGARIHERSGISVAEMKLLIPAVRVLLNGFTGRSANSALSRDNATIGRGIYDYREEAKAFFQAIEGGIKETRKQLCYAPVLSVGLATFRGGRSKLKAPEFWKRVAEQDQLEAFSGEWWLGKVMSSLNVRKGVHQSSRRVAGCWNLYYLDKKISRQPGPHASANITILGTRYSYRRAIPELF